MRKFFIFISILFCNYVCFSQENVAEIKSIWNKMNLIFNKYDDGADSLYNIINQQINYCGDSLPIEKAIWEITMAKFLDADAIHYTFLRHSSRINEELSNDYQTWSEEDFDNQISLHYLNALKEKKILGETPIKKYTILLDSLCNIEYRPTLFDLLAHEAIDYFTKELPSQPDFSLNNPQYFSNPSKFCSLEISSPDTTSNKYLIIKIFQDLTKLHLESTNNYSLIDASLQRLMFVWENSTLENRNNLYLEALLFLSHKYQHQPGYEDICVCIGNYYKQLSSKSNDMTGSDDNNSKKNAYYWYKQAIDYAPKSSSALYAQNEIDILKTKKLELYSPSFIVPNEPFFITTSYKNCDSIHIRIVSIPTSINMNSIVHYNEPDSSCFNKLMKFKSCYSNSIATPIFNDYNSHSGDILIPALPIGRYAIIIYTKFSDNEEYNNATVTFSFNELIITNLTYYKEKDESNNLKVLVVNRKLGVPKQNVSVTIKEQHTQKVIYKGVTNELGFITTSINNYIAFDIIIQDGKDCFSFDDSFYPNQKEDPKIYVNHIFTDRNIYRPGQTLYFKGIAFEGNYPPTIATNKKISISLFDPNSNRMKQLEYITNDYGSFSDSIILPTSCNTGIYRLSFQNMATCSFYVEEYKRPTFEIVLEKPKKEYRINDSIDLNGTANALAGYAISNAKGTYTISRNSSYPWWDDYNNEEEEIAHGEFITNENGTFKISFKASGTAEEQTQSPFYHYTISTSITDISGETHSTEMTIPIAENNLYIHCKIDDNIDKNRSDYQFPLTINNIANIPQQGMVTYEIIGIESPKSYCHSKSKYLNSDAPLCDIQLSNLKTLQNSISYVDFSSQNDKSTWKETIIVAEGSINTDSSSIFPIHLFSNLSEGYYKIKLHTTDRQNQNIAFEKIIYLFDSHVNDKSLYEPIQIIADHQTIESGEKLNVYISSFLEDAKILFEIISNNSIIHSEWITLNKNRYTYSMDIAQSHCGKLFFNAYLAQNNCRYEENCIVNVPFTHKKINFQFISFRDNVFPGSSENWKIKLTDYTGKPINAELLGSMYDASLDLFGNINHYNFDIAYTPIGNIRWNYLSKNLSHKTSYKNISSLSGRLYPQLDCFLNYLTFRNIYFSDKCALQSTLSFANAKEESSFENGSATLQPNFTIRENFAETAFFFPFLKTDSAGMVEFSFTIPESLTKWRFQGVAHSKDLTIGNFTRFVQTQKNFMVQANAPRFLRENDTLDFAAKIINYSDSTLSGEVTLLLFDALSNLPIKIVLSDETQTFHCNCKTTIAVNFKIAVPSNIGAIKYIIYAKDNRAKKENDVEHLQDGESAILPVLSNRTLVTEALPISINAKNEKTFSLPHLQQSLANQSSENTITHHKLTFEFTPNPIWNALLSLPYLMEYPYECNEQKFSRLYSNLIASHIVNSSPKIKQVFDQWLNTTPDAFCSNLEKNESLKNIILEETPWLMDAQNEGEKKHQIALLFDLNRMRKETNTILSQLNKAQNSDGGWAWFSGGKSSTFITEHILAGFGHLSAIGISVNMANNSITNAIHYIDRKMNGDYQLIKKNNNSINATNLHYLYTRSFYLGKYKIDNNYSTAYNYYLNNLTNKWKEQSIYEKAMCALILYRNGNRALATEIMQDIKNLAQYSEEMGMFWKKEGTGFYWYEAPIERQALLIEAFHTITHDTNSINQMQQWLIKQKQTQNWETTKATTEACFALLLNNNNIENDNEINITIGDWNYNSEHASDIEAEAGSGYIKQSWKGDEITQNMGSVNVKNQGNSVGYGALYWQYFETLDKIETSEFQPLYITKELYLITHDEKGEVLQPIQNNSLNIGDKIRVRIIIRADRDMEYIHLKDMRASALEPVNVFSEYKYQNGLFYYESTRDAATNFFIEYLPKGTFVFEYDLTATQMGTFSNGIATIQCMYAPEFTSHSKGIKITFQ